MNPRREDPVLTSSRREALLALAIWLVACVYSIAVCYRYGYSENRDPATLTYVLGMPDWIFWGVFAPWTVCTLLSFCLSYFVIRDEDLGEQRAEEHV